MKYAFMLILLGLAQIILAHDVTLFSWLLWWSGASWVLAGCAYGVIGPRAFGKRENGSLRWWNSALLLPFLTVTWFLWHLQKMLTKEAPHVEVAPGIWLGRRCFDNELPSGVQMIVDLTAEFSEPPAVMAGRAYRCLPTLDACAPAPIIAFEALIEAIAASEQPVYIHCALGHGRSATVTMAVLVARGNTASLAQAEQMVKSARPGIKISNAQRHLLQQWFSSRKMLPSP